MRRVERGSLLVLATSRKGSPACAKASRAERCMPFVTCSGEVGGNNTVGSRSAFTIVNTSITRGFKIPVPRKAVKRSILGRLVWWQLWGGAKVLGANIFGLLSFILG